MRIVILSHTAHNEPSFVIGSHHYARELAGMGHEVSYLGPPLRPARLARAIVRRRREPLMAAVPRRDRHGVVGVSLVTLGRKFPHRDAALAARCWSLSPALLCSRVRRRLEQPDVLIVDHPAHLSLVRWLQPTRLIYRPTDDYSAAVRPSERAPLALAERALIADADAVVATGLPVLERLERLAPIGRSAVIENGVDWEHFRTAHAHRTSSDVRAIYVGALDRQRFDWELLRSVALLCPEVEFLICGPIEDRPAGLPANVVLNGPIGYDDLPRLLASARVGIMPFLANTLNAGRSPMKLYEYLAAGLRVVAVETPELRRRNLASVTLTQSAEAFAREVRADTELPALAEQASCDLVADVMWPARARALLDVLHR